MSGGETAFELPRNIERYVAALSKLYAIEGKKQLQEIIVNSQIRVHEEWSSDNWNGGTYGHALYLTVPEVIFLSAVKQKDDIQKKIREDLNKIDNTPNEFIEEVFLEMEDVQDQDWRKESGLLLTGQRIILPEAQSRIWGDEGYRVFFSHKAEVKKTAAWLKNKLNIFGITGFVAHKDINPTKEWQDEIENALFSMDAFVALMTEGFHESFWTDQEVGVAFGRGVPIIAVKLGKDPYGFIGKFQALSCSKDDAAKEIAKILVKHDSMLNAYINAVPDCQSFDDGNTLAEILPFIEKLSDHQASLLISAFNNKRKVSESFGFNGKWPSSYGDGLPFHLSRLTGRTYEISDSGKIELQQRSVRR
ncbi:MAG: toll/interleukin-1 receptor domain-containing protein [Deltaproteobacteria bacterium]|nr:toll/interleukin-1 receptor domain-containing protein [Deltaproteobacteria bacterium]